MDKDKQTERDKLIEAARERLKNAKAGDRAFLLGEELKRLIRLQHIRRAAG